MTYGNGEYEDYTYDNLDRLVKVTYNGSDENAFTVLYDSNGRLAKAVDGKVGITYLYEYDSLDRLIRAYQKDSSGNTIFAVENSYDEYGRAKGSTYVIDGTEYTYGISYKENTNLVSFYSLPGNSFGYSYDSFDRLTSKINPIYGYTYSYKNGTSLVSSLTVNTDCNGTSDVYSYTYDALGNIVAVRKDGALISAYEYDALGQLIREDDVVNSKAYVYEYDNAGNILKTYTFNNTGPNVQHWMDVYPALGEITETYTYSDSAWGDLLTNYNGTNISYDSIGNPTNWIGIAALYWDGRELDSITMATNHMVDYTYNSDGIRIKKYEYNGNDMYSYTHNYVLDGSTILKETILYSSAFNGNSTTTLEYYYDESGVASFRYNGTVYHYIKNLQGDVIGIVNSNNGGIVVEYTYDAWGNVISITGELASTVGQINPFRYRGYYFDSETGLYYLNSRYYDSQVGRFINADGIIGANGGLQGYNMFAYCNNDPVMLIDPSGMIAYVCFKDSYNPTTMPWYNSSSTSGGGSGSKASRRGWRAPNMISQELKADIRNFKQGLLADIRNFNLFNDDPNVVLNSNYFSIYNGVLVIRTDLDRSGSFGIIFLTHETNNRDNPADVIRHEYGHVIQLLQLGVINYALSIGIPSAAKWGNKDYYQDQYGTNPYFNKPFEITADIFGGVQSRNYTFSHSIEGFKYMAISCALGPISWLLIRW